MIIGLTDKPILRRDGKIRAGFKEGNRLTNTDYFLLHDAPQLIERLGEKPTEIFFTIHTDNFYEAARADLRRYTSSELVCLSRHKTKISGLIDDQVAAYFGTGDAPNVMATQFPGMPRARVRQCQYKTCPDFVAGSCSEHLFLDMLIPQYSMGAIFTLDSTSILAILDVFSTFQKTVPLTGGRLAGEIFRLYKKPGEISYEAANGKRGKREAPLVTIEHVPFVKYEARFRDQISPENWGALMRLRDRTIGGASFSLDMAPTAGALAAPDEADMLQAPASSMSLQAPTAASTQESEDEKYQQLANDPVLLPMFEEIATLMGKENTENNRIATVRKTGSVQRTVDYLKARIGEIKRAKKATTPAPASTEDKSSAIDTTAKTVESTAPQKSTSALY